MKKNDKEYDDFIRNFIASNNKDLEKLMKSPLRPRRDYCGGYGRKTFLVEPLPDGALPIYDNSYDWQERIEDILNEGDE